MQKKSKATKQMSKFIDENEDEDSDDVEPDDELIADAGPEVDKLSKKTPVTMKMVHHWTKQMQVMPI